MTLLRLMTPAKVNLCLSVGAPLPGGTTDRFAEDGKRDVSGYHPIASWFAAIGVFDEVRLERLGAGAVSGFEVVWAGGGGGPSRAVEWSVDRDLTFRAHALMERLSGKRLPVRVRVEKLIPAGGGLAGGSSDAAAVMMGLEVMFGLGIGAEALREWSMRLGSDIAFFIDERELERLRDAAGTHRDADVAVQVSPRPAMVSGLGDRIERVGTPSAALDLYLPPFGCPTGAVYKAFDSMPALLNEARVRAAIASSAESGRVDDGALFNDLTAAARLAAPALGPLMDRISTATGARVHMSGSGSTLFSVVKEGMNAVEGGIGGLTTPDGVRVIRASTLA